MWRKSYRLKLQPAGYWICGEIIIGCICGQLDSGYVEKILSVVFLASWILDIWRNYYRLYFSPAGQWICGENLLAQQHEWGRLALQCWANQPSLVCPLFLLQSLQRNLSCDFQPQQHISFIMLSKPVVISLLFSVLFCMGGPIFGSLDSLVRGTS